MILTNKQNDAINLIKKNYNNHEPMTVIAGYAGVGKSSIIKYFIEEMGIKHKTVFVSFTGKAALVLRQQGLPAMTIHKLIYTAYKNYRTGKFHFKLKPILDENYSLIVIDEVSMVPKKLLDDLLSFGITVVALGDPGQLPPIGEGNGLLKNPNIFLTEIHRQAENNTIIRLSMLAREGKPIPLISDDPFVKVIKRADLDISMLLWADQVLCAKNATRHAINRQMRQHLFNTELTTPVKGDKVICLKNYWDTVNGDEFPLINGTIGNVEHITTGADYHILGQRMIIDFQADYTKELFDDIEVDSNIFKGLAPISQNLNRPSKKMFYEFDYAYAITTHKAQGSSFDNVLVYEEQLRGDQHKELLYTAITRAKAKLVLVKQF